MTFLNIQPYPAQAVAKNFMTPIKMTPLGLIDVLGKIQAELR